MMWFTNMLTVLMTLVALTGSPAWAEALTNETVQIPEGAKSVDGAHPKSHTASPQSPEGVVGFDAQQIFTGSFVIGVSGIWGPATDRDYRGVVVPGSRQAELKVVSPADVESDITLGYVHYLEDQGVNGCRGLQCFAPVFGLGLYSLRTEDILKSVLAGVNYQFNRHISIACILAVRRVNVLRDGYRLGQAVEGDLSDEDFRLGWGFMLNFSPDILKSGFRATRTLDFSSVSEKLAE